MKKHLVALMAAIVFGIGSTTLVVQATVQCSNGERDGDETDIDCGGSCGACADGRSCDVDDDCASLLCSGGTCESASVFSEDGCMTMTDIFANGDTKWNLPNLISPPRDVPGPGLCGGITPGHHYYDFYVVVNNTGHTVNMDSMVSGTASPIPGVTMRLLHMDETFNGVTAGGCALGIDKLPTGVQPELMLSTLPGDLTTVVEDGHRAAVVVSPLLADDAGIGSYTLDICLSAK